MQTITQILESLKTLSSLIFIFSTNIEPLNFLQSIPIHLLEKIESNEFKALLRSAMDAIEKLNSYLKSIEPEIKRAVNASRKHPKEPMTGYADFKVDSPPPIIRTKDSEQLSFDDIQDTRITNGLKKINPINRRTPFDFSGNCPFCGANSNYIYANNGKEQYLCKVCQNPFTTKTTISETTGFFCPHCDHKLQLHHERTNYDVFVCENQKCSFYKENKAKLSTEEKKQLKTSSNQYKLRYTYREFDFNLKDLELVSKATDTKVNLARIHYDNTVLGLALTYYVNYGLSARKTALILNEIHGVTISHQTILNYASSSSAIIKPFLDSMKYDNLSPTQAGDETYIKVRGKNQYVFFFSDPVSKIITSYMIYPNRDTKNACQAIHDAISHFPLIPENLLVITDGNPIYNAAQLFFEMNGIKFDLQQVIGVSNKDETSKKYRPQKQIEERLNRTYKANYYGTNGYDKLETANIYMVLYVAFFNFFRSHSSLKHKTPYELPGINYEDRIQNKWLQLLNLATQARISN